MKRSNEHTELSKPRKSNFIMVDMRRELVVLAFPASSKGMQIGFWLEGEGVNRQFPLILQGLLMMMWNL